MLSLSQTTGYAILALSCLDADDSHWALARDIAAHTGIPGPYLSKILHSLARSGLIVAKRGYRGGFILARPAHQISLLDIAEAVEGQAWTHRCLIGLARCSDERACPTHEYWAVEQVRIEAILRQTTLDQVARFERSTGDIYRDSPTAQENGQAEGEPGPRSLEPPGQPCGPGSS